MDRGRLRGLTATAVAVLVGVGAVLVGATPAAAQQTTNGSLTFAGEPGDYITGGREYAFLTSDGDTLSTSVRPSRDFITVSVQGRSPIDFWSLDLAAPRGQVLAPGTYFGATRASFRDGDEPGVDLGGAGRGCNTVQGSFTVTTIQFGADDSIRELDATFEQFCEGGGPPARGRVRVTEDPTILTATTLTVDPAGPVVATETLLTATVTVRPSTVAGTVQFTVNGAPNGLPDAVVNGTAEARILLGRRLGPVFIGATFTPSSPGATGSAARAASIEVAQIGPIRPQVSLTLPSRSVALGGPGTIAIDVSPPESIGEIQFFEDDRPLGAPFVTPGDRIAVPIAGLSAGRHVVSARFRSTDPRYADADSGEYEISVLPASEVPTAVDDTFSTSRDRPLSVPAPGVLSNDVDPDGDVLTALLVSQPSNVSQFLLRPDGSFTYVPAPGFTGVQTFGYVVRDSDGIFSARADLRISVTDAGQSPTVAIPLGDGCTSDGARIVLAVSDPDTDPAALTVTADPAVVGGRPVTIEGTGATRTLVVRPNGAGRTPVTVTVSDGASSATTALSLLGGTNRSEVLRGTAGIDVIVARGGVDIVTGGSGNDLICGGDGSDVLLGQDGDDVLEGQGGSDVLVGGPGQDVLRGGPGLDWLLGDRSDVITQ